MREEHLPQLHHQALPIILSSSRMLNIRQSVLFIWSIWFIWFVLFIWLRWFIWLVSFNQKTKQTRQTR